MSVNDYLPHVFVLPEDDANSEIATGFYLEIRQPRKMQVLPSAGGWTNARDAIYSQHEKSMRRYPGRHLVILIDFDDDLDRGLKIREKLADDLKGRVFIIGAKVEPEQLKQAGLGSLEAIGSMLAIECRDGGPPVSNHDLLKHNQRELIRLKAAIFDIIF